MKAACNKPGLVPQLEIIVTELEKCKKSLSEYLRYVDDAIDNKFAPAFLQRFRKRKKSRFVHGEALRREAVYGGGGGLILERRRS